LNIKLNKTYKGHKDAIYKIIPFSDHYFLSGSGDGLLVKWAVEGAEKPQSIAKAGGGIYSISLVGKEYVAIGTNNGLLHIIDHSNKTLLHNFKIAEPAQAIFDIVFHEEHKQLICATAAGELVILNTDTWEEVKREKVSEKNLRSLSINPSGTMLAAGGSDNDCHIFSLPDIRPIRTLKGHSSSIFTAVFIDETHLLTGARDAHLKHWEVIDGNEIASLPAHMFTINEIAFSPNRAHFVTVSRDKSIKIWATKELKLLKVIERTKGIDTHTHSVNTVAWMGGKKIITGGDDRKILVWEF